MRKKMAQIVKPKFHVLNISGQNYQSWRLDVELHLQEEGLADTLVEYGKVTVKDKVNALIFMRRHLYDLVNISWFEILWNYGPNSWKDMII